MKIPAEIIQKYPVGDADTAVLLSVFDEPIGKVLEVGANDEPIANILSEMGNEVYGIDLLPYDSKLPPCNYTYYQGDFCRPSDSFMRKHYGTFDTIVCISAIEHFGLHKDESDRLPFYDVIAAHVMWQLLKEGGACYISVPCGKSAIAYGHHWRVYNREAIDKRLVQEFVREMACLFIADLVEINGEERNMGDPISWEEVAEYDKPWCPHISVLLKLRKAPIFRKVLVDKESLVETSTLAD